VIGALGNIRDMRAVPVLQEIASDAQNLLAPMARQAAEEILRNSRDESAQLLRPTDSRHAGKAAETLLRPAADTGVTPRPDELLRPGAAPPVDRKNEA
jgi:HEAT repeat protein